jgi:hypothetical protein
MSILLGNGEEESRSSPILVKIKDVPNYKYQTLERPLFELAIKSKTLISYKSRYMKIYDKFILIFKVNIIF